MFDCLGAPKEYITCTVHLKFALRNFGPIVILESQGKLRFIFSVAVFLFILNRKIYNGKIPYLRILSALLFTLSIDFSSL